jgi:hypothetical protein
MWQKFKDLLALIGWALALVFGGIVIFSNRRPDSKDVHTEPMGRDRERIQELAEANSRVESITREASENNRELGTTIDLAEKSSNRLGDLLGIGKENH